MWRYRFFMNFVLSTLILRPMPPAARSRPCSRVSARVGVFAKSAMSLCRVSSASFLCQLKTVIFHFINRNSKHVVYADDKKICVVYWPPTRPNMPFQRRRKCIFYWCGRAWLTIWDRVKIPRYSHKLMHRKRVTCELHDSYFRSMTIKHAIPKTAEVHIQMASYGEMLSGCWTII